MKHFNNLTPAQAERLALLAEEAGEIVQAVTKILRHGYDSYNPDDPVNLDNREQLEKELGQLDNAVKLAITSGDLRPDEIDKHAEQKRHTIDRWLHHNCCLQPEEG